MRRRARGDRGRSWRSRTRRFGRRRVAETLASQRLRARPPARPPSSTGPLPDAGLLAVDRRRAQVNVRSCGGPVDLEHGVADLAAGARERLLELGLVVDVRRQRVLDPLANASTIACSIGSKPCSRKSAASAASSSAARTLRLRESRSSSSAAAPCAALGEHRAEVELARDDGAARARDDVRADLREPALARSPGSGRRARARPRARARCRRGTRAARTTTPRSGAHDECVKTVLGALRRQRVDQPPELAGLAGRAAATGATRRSRRPGRRSGSSGRPRPRS